MKLDTRNEHRYSSFACVDAFSRVMNNPAVPQTDLPHVVTVHLENT